MTVVVAEGSTGLSVVCKAHTKNGVSTQTVANTVLCVAISRQLPVANRKLVPVSLHYIAVSSVSISP